MIEVLESLVDCRQSKVVSPSSREQKRETTERNIRPRSGHLSAPYTAAAPTHSQGRRSRTGAAPSSTAKECKWLHSFPRLCDQTLPMGLQQADRPQHRYTRTRTPYSKQASLVRNACLRPRADRRLVRLSAGVEACFSHLYVGDGLDGRVGERHWGSLEGGDLFLMSVDGLYTYFAWFCLREYVGPRTCSCVGLR